MKRQAPTALACSVRDRLKTLADSRHEDFQDVLLRFGVERLLYRLCRSQWHDRFVLKGAMLFAVWADKPYRTTRDVDLLGFGDVSVPAMEHIFQTICSTDVEPDGLTFRVDTVAGERIRAGRSYEGVRISLQAELARALIHLQVDIGVGDQVVPMPRPTELPTLLPMAAPRLRVYSRYSVVAEKLETLVEKGSATSRLKDLADLLFLSRTWEFDGPTLVRAVRGTFERRATRYPAGVPEALGETFAALPAKRAQWQAFVRRSRLIDAAPRLAEVVAALRDFVLPPLTAARTGTSFARHWFPDRGWRARAPAD
jgi:hypothetical protein